MHARVERIRRRLSRAHPVLGRLASFLEVSLLDDSPCAVETGINTLRFAPDYAQQAADDELGYWLAHASLHMALLHFDPPPGAAEDWSRRCDAQLESLLRQLGFFPLQAVGMERHRWWQDAGEEGGTAAQQRMGGVAAEDAPSASVRQSQVKQWRARVQQAAGEALGAGDADGVLLRALRGSAPKSAAHDWRAQLAAFLQRWHQAEAHYGRASRRARAPFLLPSLRPAALHLLVAVDTSASIKEAQLQQFWAEIQSLAGQINMQLVLLAADTRLASGAPWVFAPGEVPIWPAPHGQGGTDFRPVFHWLEHSEMTLDALVYFTDGKGDYPPVPPALPVLWALAGEGGDVRMPQFGEVVRL
ncbi:MAG: VWA-like domain-containing protein [Pseudomonadota bacterium]